MAKLSAEILQEMIDFLSTNSNFTDVDKGEGSVLRDVVLDSVARQLEKIYTEIESTKQLSLFVENAELITESDMDSIAQNYNLTRLPATKAVGEITFRKKNLPGSPITIGNIEGTGGIILATRQLSDGTTVQFITTETVILNTNAVLNPATNYYEVVADIEAIIEGNSGNVSTGSITNLESAISGIDTVYNSVPTGSGSAAETNTELASRILLAIAGNNRVNKAGYELFVRNNFVKVTDVLVVDPNKPDSVRGPGTIDIYVLGDDIRSTSEEITFIDSGVSEYSLSNKPVSSITSLTAKVSGVDTVLTQDTDYELLKDGTSIVAYSTTSKDKIKFKDLGIKPDDGTAFTINYSYNKLINDVQEFYELEENKILCVDVMIKETIPVLLDIEFSVKYFSGNTTRLLELQESIINALTSYISDLGLGATVSQSDIVFAIKDAVKEVDNITLPFTSFKKRNDSLSSDEIEFESKEYPSIDSSTFTITVL